MGISLSTGGLGNRRLEVQNKSFLFKLGISLGTSSSLQIQVALFRLRNQVVRVFGDHSRGYRHNFEATFVGR